MLPYAELHAHSGFSFLDGASHPAELVGEAVKLGYRSMALTDHDGLYGSMEFACAAKDAGLQAVTGVELAVAGCLPGDTLHHVTLIAETPRGYSNLCRLVTEAHTSAGAPKRIRAESTRSGPVGLRPESGPAHSGGTRPGGTRSGGTRPGGAHPGGARPGSPHPDGAHPDGPRPDGARPALPLASLLERSEGVILLTGCRQGPLAAALRSSVADAENFISPVVSAFGARNVFVELQNNFVRGDAPGCRALASFADSLGLGVVATGNVHYHRRSRHRLQDVLISIRERATLDASHRARRANSLFHLPSQREMNHRFLGRPDALVNSVRIAQRCASFDITEDLGYEFPDFDGGGDANALDALGALCRTRLAERYDRPSREFDEAQDRLDTELALVDLHGLAGFFLVYRDIMELAAEAARDLRGNAPRAGANLPPGRGRGSSVSSIICYLIGLSHIDPVKNNLFLGRFLNEALEGVPDIDLDFPRDIREELILRVHEKYGDEHSALVCTFPTYRLRSAVREIGKVLELPAGDLEKLSKLAGSYSAAGLADEIRELPGFGERADSPPWRMLAELAGEIAGLPRHISQHVGGMIVSSRPLVELVPLQPAAWEGRVLCQWDKDSCDDAGFVKIDLLALGMLSLVEETTDLIAERHGLAPDLSRIDFADEAVYDRLCAGDNVGIFQVESRAQIQMIRRTRPRSLSELAVQVAIVRPGPIVGGAVNPYVRRRELLRENPDYEVPYPHPLLKEALGETLGVVVFQDQVLAVCQVLAGFSDGEAESLRRAMSRKRSRDALRAHWDRFREGAAVNGVDGETARTIFAQVIAFSEFGFPKSHAAAFGLLAYQSAWLRHYYPVEFYVGLFNNQPMGFYSLDALGRDCRRNGVATLLPDVNKSRARCTAEGGDLRIGLGFVREWGEEIACAVVEERIVRGDYRSLPDLLRRTSALRLSRAALESLVWVGGLDSFGLSRRELLWQAGLWLGPDIVSSHRAGSPPRRSRGGGRRGGEIALDDPYADLAFPELGEVDKMMAEYQALGFSAELHPFAPLRDALPRGVLRSDELLSAPRGAEVSVAGLVTARQRPQTAKGYVFVLMEDEHGPVNVIIRPDVYERYRDVVRLEPFLLVLGTLRRDGATLNVVAGRVKSLLGEEVAGRPGDPGNHSPYDYLGALRRDPPGIKSWG